MKEAKTVLKFLTNHQRVLAIFRSKCSRQLLKPGETRFATEIIMLDRMFEQKQAIKETVHDADFETWMEEQSAAVREKGEEVVANVKLQTFWANMDMLLQATKPIFYVLRSTDSDKPTTGDVYYEMYQVEESIRKIQRLSKAAADEIVDKFIDRWNGTIHHSIHGAGYQLNPKFHATKGFAWKETNEERELVNKRMEGEFLEEVMEGLTKSLEKFYHKDPLKAVEAMKQYSSYRAANSGWGVCRRLDLARSTGYSSTSMVGDLRHSLPRPAGLCLQDPGPGAVRKRM